MTGLPEFARSLDGDAPALGVWPLWAWLVVLIGGPLLAAAWAGCARRASGDNPARRHRRRVARRALAALQAPMLGTAESVAILRGYLKDVFVLPASCQTPAEVIAHVKPLAGDGPAGHVAAFLERVDAARFGTAPTEDDFPQAAARVIKELEGVAWSWRR